MSIKPPPRRSYSHVTNAERADRGELGEKLPTRTRSRSWRVYVSSDYLCADIDPTFATGPLSAYCFMTGFINAISFSSIYLWVGFQSGNWAQLAIAIARLFEGEPGNRDFTFHIADQQALVSLLSFFAGTFFARLGDKIGPRTRTWLASGTLVQAILTLVATICISKSGQASIGDDRGDPSWTMPLSFVTVAFISASLGLQGVMSRKLDTPFSASLVLTTAWCELWADPKLFKVRTRVLTRDHKLVTAAMIFFGAFVGRAVTETVGDTWALSMATIFRLVLSVVWIFIPGPVP